MMITSSTTAGERLETLFPRSGPSRIEWKYPARLVMPLSWAGHIPFAFWLVEAARPRTLVELGVHTGNSYCAFLQAVRTLGLAARCSGIDHWGGDVHAGFYDDEIYNELRAWHDPQYGQFSTLLRSRFDEAVGSFADASIDLLHIDGFHTYEAVAHDFNTWLPKMSPRGIVLLHDVGVRDQGFGVWRMWEEIAARYPAFEFAHAHGLGVAYVGSEPLEPRLEALFTPDDRVPEYVRAYFSRLGASISDRYSHEELGRQLQYVETLRVELNQTQAQVAALQHDMGVQKAHDESRVAQRDRELESIKTSSSWRMTQPIRTVSTKLQELRQTRRPK